MVYVKPSNNLVVQVGAMCWSDSWLRFLFAVFFAGAILFAVFFAGFLLGIILAMLGGGGAIQVPFVCIKSILLFIVVAVLVVQTSKKSSFFLVVFFPPVAVR
jgi:hypothetical protein